MSTQTTVAGPELFDRMKLHFDYEQILWTMMRYDENQTRERATELLDSFLQWFSLLPAIQPGGTYVMLKTPVEEAFHAFVLNTRLYQEFCQQFLGTFFHHDPVTEERAPELVDGIRYTVELLEKTYGNELLPPLREWRNQLDAGTAQIACVGCKNPVAN